MEVIIFLAVIFIIYQLFKGSSTEKPKEISPTTLINQYNEEIKLKRPVKKRKLASFDNTLPADLIITEEFSTAFNLMNNTSDNLYITGKAGTGKSTLLKYFRIKTKKNIVILAPTGIAALQINGQTIHSFFRFPPKIIDLETIFQNPQRSELFKKIDTIIIDEISMVRADLIDAIDKSMRVHRSNDRPFGNVQMVYFGDLYQLPPVVVGQAQKNYFDKEFGGPYFFNAKTFSRTSIKTIELSKIFRQDGDLEFINILNEVRLNQASDNSINSLNRRVVNNFIPQKNDFFITLTTTNKLSNSENLRRLESIPSDLMQYEAIVSGTFNKKSYPTDENLELKVGAQIMTLKNDGGKQFVNGSIGKITKLTSEEIYVQINNSTIKLDKHVWEEVEYQYNKDSGKIEATVVGSFTQFPIKLAWSITIHKSQGQTFDQVIIDLGNGAFAHGQTYVALSRCSSLEGIILKRNISWRDIILDHRIQLFMNTIN